MKICAQNRLLEYDATALRPISPAQRDRIFAVSKMPETAPQEGAARQIGVKQPVWKMRLRPSEPAIDGRAHPNRFPDEEHRAAARISNRIQRIKNTM